jgi:hypothetical protein
MANTPEYNLPSNSYCNFDATSLKTFMIEQLNASGKFTDQNYEGSNIASLLDILAYYTHVLLFYLNQTSSESSFSQASIYENMNRIVKLIGYKPTGKQTSLVSINCRATASLPSGNYKIRKYSYFLVDNIQYTFLNDEFFEKFTDGVENIESINENAILYQGTVGEYPVYVAEGIDYENLKIVVDNITSNKDTRFISQGSIGVYVKESNNNRWFEYAEVDSLFLSSPKSRTYELRLNENGHYEVKFGNDVFGKKLNPNDEVNIFYILSDGQKGQIGKNSINGNKLFIYNSARFNDIYTSINEQTESITETNKSFLIFNNPTNSTIIEDAESVEQIRDNAPVFLSSQLRLVTETDYEKYLKKTIPNILNDVKVVDNKTFMDEYIKYFYDICVDPNKVNRVILNQVNFADSCDFNNINVFCVPTFNTTQDGVYPEFLSNSFKNLIIGITRDKKIISNEVVPRDPIYVGIDLGYSNNPNKNTYKETTLVISREKNSNNKDTIKAKVLEIILEYFKPSNISLGQTIDLSAITSAILSIDGVRGLKTVNNTDRSTFNGISLLAWNPVFDDVDVSIINQTTTLPFFKFPYIINPVSLINRISVIDE